MYSSLSETGISATSVFSSHNPTIAIRAINTGLPEMMLFSINPAFDMLPAGEYVFDHLDKGFGDRAFPGYRS